MEFIDHTIRWFEGEIFESTLIGIAGFLLIGLSIVCWQLGKTSGTQALFVPLLVTGVIFAGSGITGMINNQQSIESIKEAYIHNPDTFVVSEKERVEGFQYLYTSTKVMAGVLFFSAITIFFATDSHNWQAVAIAFVLIGGAGLVVDYFSKERADVYWEVINRYLGEEAVQGGIK